MRWGRLIINLWLIESVNYWWRGRLLWGILLYWLIYFSIFWDGIKTSWFDTFNANGDTIVLTLIYSILRILSFVVDLIKRLSFILWVIAIHRVTSRIISTTILRILVIVLLLCIVIIVIISCIAAEKFIVSLINWWISTNDTSL